jgi:anaerobic selenocysteine-containing dehydrogenase
MGYGDLFPWNSDEEVVAHMLEPSGLTLEQLQEQPEGVIFGDRLYEMPERIRTPSGKIELYSPSLADFGQDPLPVHKEPTQSPVSNPELVREYPLVLVTGARIPEYTHWQMKNIPELRRMAPHPVAWIHPRVAESAGVEDGEDIFVETRKDRVRVKAAVTAEIMEGVVSLTHGWEEEENANRLTELDARDPVTGYCEFSNLACKVEKAGTG